MSITYTHGSITIWSSHPLTRAQRLALCRIRPDSDGFAFACQSLTDWDDILGLPDLKPRYAFHAVSVNHAAPVRYTYQVDGDPYSSRARALEHVATTDLWLEGNAPNLP